MELESRMGLGTFDKLMCVFFATVDAMCIVKCTVCLYQQIRINASSALQSVNVLRNGSAGGQLMEKEIGMAAHPPG